MNDDDTYSNTVTWKKYPQIDNKYSIAEPLNPRRSCFLVRCGQLHYFSSHLWLNLPINYFSYFVPRAPAPRVGLTLMVNKTHTSLHSLTVKCELIYLSFVAWRPPATRWRSAFRSTGSGANAFRGCDAPTPFHRLYKWKRTPHAWSIQSQSVGWIGRLNGAWHRSVRLFLSVVAFRSSHSQVDTFYEW